MRYATTLGTNALIERKGPRIGLLVTAGFKSTIPLSRARGYGEGLAEERDGFVHFSFLVKLEAAIIERDDLA